MNYVIVFPYFNNLFIEILNRLNKYLNFDFKLILNQRLKMNSNFSHVY